MRPRYLQSIVRACLPRSCTGTRGSRNQSSAVHYYPDNQCSEIFGARILASRARHQPKQLSTSLFSTVDHLQSDLKTILSQLGRHGNSKATTTVQLDELNRLYKLVQLILKHPDAAREVWQSGAVPVLVELSQCGWRETEKQARVALSLLGYAPPYAGRGLRILAIDGGGTRGVVPLMMLKRLEQLCGKESYKLFDYVCGTSTGAALASLLFVLRTSIEDAEQIYHQFISQVFKTNNLLGIGQFFLNHAYYDSKLLEKFIRKANPQAECYLYETAMDSHTPRFSVVSTIVNQPIIQPFLFTNYRHHPSQLPSAHYQSDCTFRYWEALKASTAATLYFEEVKLGPHVLQDGGLLTNNPTAIALHEARLLWGAQVPIQSIVSLGTGLYSKPLGEEDSRGSNSVSVKNTSLKDKLTNVLLSATDTEVVHTILKDLLPSSTYFRFNPSLSEDIMIDENRPEKLELLVKEAESYLSANGEKLEQAAACLLQEKQVQQKARDWLDRGWNKIRSRTSTYL